MDADGPHRACGECVATLEPGRRLSHYVVVELIGAGGMGEVYRARDERLDRDVAIKVIGRVDDGLATRRQRFLDEAKVLARSSHPNILEIHDIGTDGDLVFAVTELLEGETLRARLAAGRLPWRKAVEFGTAIADGLSAAHGRRIVHRDLKPENVFITREGHVKILDFGLALVVPPVPRDDETVELPLDRTEPGTVLGTVGYMAPEQVRGETADGRSDTFALGCMLYEMLSGQRPFARDSSAETMSAILRDEPPELASVEFAVSPELARIVDHCLEKRPDERFQSARDLAFDLRSILTGSTAVATLPSSRPGARIGWIAAVVAIVLLAAAIYVWNRGREPRPDALAGLDPDRVAVSVFENRTGDPALDAVGSMAADWITHGLAETGDVEVVPGMSSLAAFRGNPDALPTEDPLLVFAEATGAGTVVSGSYYLQGESLVFNVRVTDLARGELVHAFQPIRGPRGEPAEVVEELKQRVKGLFAISAESQAEWRLSSTPPRFEAYREYVAGLDVFGSDDARAALHFQRAAEYDSQLVVPRLYLAYMFGAQGDRESQQAVFQELSDRRDQLSPFEQKWLGIQMAYAERRYAEALRLLQEAQGIAPRDLMVRHWTGLIGLYLNRPQLIVETMGSADMEQVRDHAAWRYWYNILSRAHHRMGEDEQALVNARRAVDWSPDDAWFRTAECAALAGLGRLDEVRRAVDRALTQKPSPGFTAADLFIYAADELHVHGHPEAALEMAQRAVDWSRRRSDGPNSSGSPRLDLARALSRTGQWDESESLVREFLGNAPENVDALGLHGVLAARQGNRVEAQSSSSALAHIADPYVWGQQTYERACIAAVLGEKDKAVDLLREAFAQGFASFERIHRDPDLDSLRDYPPFQDLVRVDGG